VTTLILGIIAVVLVCLLGMVAAGDLRVTSRQQREWQAGWDAMPPEERERIARLTWL
jgi:hypothetical protein